MNIIDELRAICASLPARNLAQDKLKELTGVFKKVSDELRIRSFTVGLEVKPHVRQGNIADAPWIGFHDPRIESKPQTGLYCALIFRVDGSGLAVSLQRGIDKCASQREIIARAKAARQEFSIPDSTFKKEAIRLLPTSDNRSWSERPRKYEQSSIVGKEYDLMGLPSEEQFVQDLTSQLEMDKQYASRPSWQKPNGEVSGEEGEESDYQNPDKRIKPAPVELHPPSRSDRPLKPSPRQQQRDIAQGQRALRNAKYRCEADDTHTTFITSRGKAYVEKHHLIPIARRDEFDRDVDHQANIFALCPLCHRKIHYSKDDTRNEVIMRLFKKRKSTFDVDYKLSVEDVFRYYASGNKVSRRAVVDNSE